VNQLTFPPTSRYAGLDTAVYRAPDGTEIVYLTRRFVPQPGEFAILHTHLVIQGERIDNIAAQELGDPEQYWRICDAGGAIRPAELVERPGRRLNITLPHGIPGSPGA
jgi:hypothetical protein